MVGLINESTDLSEQLLRLFPLTFPRYRAVECNRGWTNLIMDLCYKIEKENQRLLESGTIREELPSCVQIKEKFGELRFYMDTETTQMSLDIEIATKLSRETCEFCGSKDGKTRKTNWIMTICDDCFKDFKKKAR